MKMKVRPISKDDELISSAIYVSFTDDQVRMYKRHLEQTTELYAWTLDDELVCLWGMIPGSFMSDEVFIWSQALPGVAKCKSDFIRAARHSARYAFSKYSLIRGFCDPSVGSLRLLRCLGADFLPPIGSVIPFTIRSPYG